MRIGDLAAGRDPVLETCYGTDHTSAADASVLQVLRWRAHPINVGRQRRSRVDAELDINWHLDAAYGSKCHRPMLAIEHEAIPIEVEGIEIKPAAILIGIVPPAHTFR